MSAFRAVGFALAVLAVLSAALLAVDFLVFFALLPFAAWPLFLYLDADSTKRMYLQSPAKFERVERNPFFVALVQHLGFAPAFPTFVVLVEIPTFALISFVIAPALGSYLFGGASLLSCLAAGAGVLAFAHADGWRTNRAALKR